MASNPFDDIRELSEIRKQRELERAEKEKKQLADQENQQTTIFVENCKIEQNYSPMIKKVMEQFGDAIFGTTRDKNGREWTNYVSNCIDFSSTKSTNFEQYSKVGQTSLGWVKYSFPTPVEEFGVRYEHGKEVKPIYYFVVQEDSSFLVGFQSEMVDKIKKFTGLLIVAKAKAYYTSETVVQYYDEMRSEYNQPYTRFDIQEKKIIQPNEKSLIEALKDFARSSL